MNLLDLVFSSLNGGIRIVMHHCSMCRYPCSYFKVRENFFYDSGCDCLLEKLVEERTEEEIMKSLDKADLNRILRQSGIQPPPFH